MLISWFGYAIYGEHFGKSAEEYMDILCVFFLLCVLFQSEKYIYIFWRNTTIWGRLAYTFFNNCHVSLNDSSLVYNRGKNPQDYPGREEAMTDQHVYIIPSLFPPWPSTHKNLQVLAQITERKGRKVLVL